MRFRPKVEELEPILALDTALASRFFNAAVATGEFKTLTPAQEYVDYLGRPATQAENNFWLQFTPLQYTIGIAGSREFDLKDPGIGDKVYKFYAFGCGRLPDDPGWLFWTGSHLPAAGPTPVTGIPPNIELPPAPSDFPGGSVLDQIGTNSQGTPILVARGFDPGPTENGAATWQLSYTPAGSDRTVPFGTVDDLSRRSIVSFFQGSGLLDQLHQVQLT